MLYLKALVCFANEITFPRKIITLIHCICIWQKHGDISLNKGLLWFYFILKAAPELNHPNLHQIALMQISMACTEVLTASMEKSNSSVPTLAAPTAVTPFLPRCLDNSLLDTTQTSALAGLLPFPPEEYALDFKTDELGSQPNAFSYCWHVTWGLVPFPPRPTKGPKQSNSVQTLLAISNRESELQRILVSKTGIADQYKSAVFPLHFLSPSVQLN